MMMNLNNKLVNKSRVTTVDFSTLQSETIVVTLDDDSTHSVTGFAALEIIWLLKPSALEGNNKIKWQKNAWVIHNLFAPPIMQILAFFKLYEQAIWIHDITVPKPIGYK